MQEIEKRNIFGFWFRFTLVYCALYCLTAMLFLSLQTRLPENSRVALDFFQPYSLSLNDILSQVIIASIIALVLFLFYDLIVSNKYGLLVIFAALWGVVLVGSLEPKVGTIEGMLYTETTFFEHILVLGAGAFQYLLVAWFFLLWERKVAGIEVSSPAINPWKSDFLNEYPVTQKSYLIRFTILHLIVYMLVGALFYEISGYEEALATMEEFALWRELENIIMPFVILFGQLFRGAVNAFFLYPFYPIYMARKQGWALLFLLLLSFKVLATVITVPETAAEAAIMLAEAKIGLPEIFAQTFIFALLFFAWEKRAARKAIAKKAG